MAKDFKDKRCGDKIRHLFTEFTIAAIVGVATSFIHFSSSWYAFWIAFIVAFAVGVFKDSMNVHKTGHHFSLFDLLLDFIGCLLGASVALIANYVVWYPIVDPVIP